MEKEYYDETEEIDDELEELTEEELELREIEKEQSTKVRNGQVEFANVNHSKRANKMGRTSDTTKKRNITKYCNVALEYFGYRCALSGERFVSFDEKVEGKKSNLSAEHIIALALGGNDIVPNLAPTVGEYNRIKNGYYLLEYWDKQKDIEGKNLYSPYRLLKLVNYMMKSVEVRDDVIKDRYRAYKKKLMTPNEIDKFLAEIEQQDELEHDNSKKKIHSDTITATTEDVDSKKILTRVPSVEGAMLIQRKQPNIEKQLKVDMMDIFLRDAVELLNRTPELQQVRLKDKDGNEISLQDKLDEMLNSSIGVIPFEVEVRNAILEKLEALGIKNNKYSVANELLNNTQILEMAKENRENVTSIVEDYIENQLTRIREVETLNGEQVKTVISNMPTVLYDEKEMNKIKLWSTYRSGSFEELISRNYTETDTLVDVFIVLKDNGIDLSKIVQSDENSTTIEDLIKEKDEEEQNKIISKLQEISEEITKDWPVGKKLRIQKKARNMFQLKEEIDKAGITFTSEEKQKILEKQKLMSKITTSEFVQVLIVLKINGIDLSRITYTGKIEDLIKEKDKEEQNEIINKLQEISEEITKDWPIGKRLVTQKARNMFKLKEEIDKAGITFTLEEKQKILEKQELMSKITTSEFVQVLIILKTKGIDLAKIVRSGKIGDLIKEKEKEEQNEIINELQEISEEITKDWPIGQRLGKQKSNNIMKLKEEIYKAGLELTPEEQEKILEKEDKKELSERKTKEFVQVLVILKTKGIDLSRIAYNVKIEDLIEEKEKEEQNEIINELREISEEITKDWPISERLHNQKVRNKGRLKEEIDKAGLILTLEEQNKILGKSTQKKVKQTVVEQKNKGELGQNRQIEEDIFEETIRHAEQTQEAEASAR